MRGFLRSMIMTISALQKKHLRRIGHQLRPVVRVAGNGLSESVATEIDARLTDHELIKVKLAVADRETRKALSEAICAQHKAELVQSVGQVILLYRKAEKPDPRLSNLLNRRVKE